MEETSGLMNDFADLRGELEKQNMFKECNSSNNSKSSTGNLEAREESPVPAKKSGPSASQFIASIGRRLDDLRKTRSPGSFFGRGDKSRSTEDVPGST